MEKWKKVIICVVVLLAVLAGGGYGVFKFYIQPKYIDTAIEQVSDILQSQTVQNEVDKFVTELQEEGYLSDEQVAEYMKAAQEMGLNDAAVNSASENIVSQEPNEEPSGEMVPEEEDAGKPSAQTKAPVKEKQGEQAAVSNSDSDPEYITGDGNISTAQPSESPKATEEPTKDTGKSKTERVLSALTASELSFVNSIRSKIDVGTATSLMSSDYEKFKEYIKSHLSGDEISRCLSLYVKYAYLLNN